MEICTTVHNIYNGNPYYFEYNVSDFACTVVDLA